MDGLARVVVIVAVAAGGIGLVAFQPAARRGLIALAALAGPVVGSLGTFMILALSQDNSACDGLPCGDWSIALTTIGGVAAAFAFALSAWLAGRYFARPS